MNDFASILSTNIIVLVVFVACAILFAACGLLIGAFFTFGKMGELDVKVMSLERVVANQHHVIQCLKSALEVALNYISKTSPAELDLAENWAKAVELDAANLPFFPDAQMAKTNHPTQL